MRAYDTGVRFEPANWLYVKVFQLSNGIASMYIFTSGQLQELKRIAKAECHLDFSDTEILEMATNLVRAFDVISRYEGKQHAGNGSERVTRQEKIAHSPTPWYDMDMPAGASPVQLRHVQS